VRGGSAGKVGRRAKAGGVQLGGRGRRRGRRGNNEGIKM